MHGGEEEVGRILTGPRRGRQSEKVGVLRYAQREALGQWLSRKGCLDELQETGA
jgi:hypothetical protein